MLFVTCKNQVVKLSKLLAVKHNKNTLTVGQILSSIFWRARTKINILDISLFQSLSSCREIGKKTTQVLLFLLVPSLFSSFYYEQIRRKDGLCQTHKLNNIEWSWWCQLSTLVYCIIRPFNKIGSYFIGQHFKRVAGEEKTH